jgi:hypothetical protein
MVPQFPHWQIYGLLIFEPKSCVTSFSFPLRTRYVLTENLNFNH